MKYARMYMNSYTMNPKALTNYLSLGTKKIVFEDIITDTIENVKDNFNETLIQSVSNVKKLIIIPVFRAPKGLSLNGL